MQNVVNKIITETKFYYFFGGLCKFIVDWTIYPQLPNSSFNLIVDILVQWKIMNDFWGNRKIPACSLYPKSVPKITLFLKPFSWRKGKGKLWFFDIDQISINITVSIEAALIDSIRCVAGLIYLFISLHTLYYIVNNFSDLVYSRCLTITLDFYGK